MESEWEMAKKDVWGKSQEIQASEYFLVMDTFVLVLFLSVQQCLSLYDILWNCTPTFLFPIGYPPAIPAPSSILTVSSEFFKLQISMICPHLEKKFLGRDIYKGSQFFCV